MGYILTIILFLFILFLGIYISNKIDIFIDLNKGIITKEEKKILIIGCKDVSKDIEYYLNKNNIKYEITYDNNIRNLHKSYRLVIVAFKNDLDNLMLCSFAKKFYNIDTVVSICNNFENTKIFNDYKVISVNRDEIYNEKFLGMIKEKIKNE